MKIFRIVTGWILKILSKSYRKWSFKLVLGLVWVAMVSKEDIKQPSKQLINGIQSVIAKAVIKVVTMFPLG